MSYLGKLGEDRMILTDIKNILTFLKDISKIKKVNI